MPKIPAVAITLLALLPALGTAVVAGEGARAEAVTFTPPPFRVGDVANYTGPVNPGHLDGKYNYTVGAPTLVRDKSNQLVDAFPISQIVDGVPILVNYVSPETMTNELSVGPCPSGSTVKNGACTIAMKVYSWASQGIAAGAAGETLVQGRSFSIGDSWVVEGECAGCRFGPIHVTIEPPRTGAPEGTAYTVAWVGGTRPFTGRFDMGTEHAFPLDGLLNFTPGTTPILPATPPRPWTYTPPLPVVPFENGFAVEGTPLNGLPSWSDARNSTLLLPDTKPAGALFLELKYRPFAWETSVLGSQVVHHELRIEERYVVPGQLDHITRYDHHSLRIQGLAPVEAWERSSSSYSHATQRASSCVDRSVVFWDAHRFTESLGLLHNLTMFQWSYDSACQTPIVRTYGDSWAPPGGVLAYIERVDFDAATGYLRLADVISYDYYQRG